HNEFNLKFLRDADSFAEASLALHLQAEGMVLTLFRFSEYISPTEGDKKLFRLVMQDEARHVGYGMQHLKWVLDHFPEKRELIHHHLDEAENFVFGAGYATEVLEPFIILSCKGLKKEHVAEGTRITIALQATQTEYYFEDDELIQLVTSILEGNLTLDWYRVETPRVRARPADPGRGLTYEDCNLGPYGYDAIPEFLRDRYSMASRGSALVAKLPDLG